jgi:Sulfotransferase domain
MAIKVIGAGFGRTGTMSLKVALEDLGFGKCYHFTEAMGKLTHLKAWHKASHGHAIAWGELFEGYQSAIDFPACAFYKELMVRYPDAKVVLTVRDPERWYDSARSTIYAANRAFPWWGRFFPRMWYDHDMSCNVIWNGTFHGRFEDKAYTVDLFKKHTVDVQRTVPPERLLIFDVAEGWEPLCRFLGVPVPEDKPFPHVNNQAEFKVLIERYERTMRLVPLAVAIPLLAVGVWLAMWWRG